MASGMGMPSIGIYSYELYNFFGVENILRVGSAGAISTNVHVYDLVLGMGAKCQAHRAERGKKQRLFHVLLDFGRFVYCKYNQIFLVVINR